MAAAARLVDESVSAPARAGGNAVHRQLARLGEALRRENPAPTAVRRWTLVFVVGLTVLINAMAVATPMVTLAVFDYVVRDGAHFTLAVLCAAGGLSVVYELMLRRVRAAMAADIGVRGAAQLSAAFFSGLLRRDVREAAGEPVSAQVARFRTVRVLRRFLTGPVTGALLDAPFVLLMAGALAIWFGPVGAVPVAALLLYVAAARLLRPHAVRVAQHSERAREELRVALAESAAKRETLDELGMARAWAQRVESLALEAAARRDAEASAEAARDAVAHGIAALAIVATLWIGAERVLSGALTLGGVIAATMLVWRCVWPMEALFRSATQVRTAIGALRSVRPAPGKGFERTRHLAAPTLAGALSVRGLVVRSAQGNALALRGISLDVTPGEVVAICGPAGAGKSTLLEAVLGLAKAESGTIAIDGRDLRGLDQVSYRTQSAYAPQGVTLFHGTVAQNIRLQAPAADAAQMTASLARAGVRLPHPQLPDGVETRLMSGGVGQIDESLRVKVMLAGLYAKDARLYLLDDPGAFLDRDGDVAFLRALAELRGRATVLLVTNRPSHMRACDRIVRLEHGMVVTDGSVEQVLGVKQV